MLVFSGIVQALTISAQLDVECINLKPLNLSIAIECGIKSFGLGRDFFISLLLMSLLVLWKAGVWETC